MTKVSLYVGTYSKYNDANLFGEWVELTSFQDLESFYYHIYQLHKDEEDPEFLYNDWEAPKFLEEMGLIGESYLAPNIFEVIEMVEKSGISEEVFEAYGNVHGSFPSIEETIDHIENTYCGEFESDEDFARWLLEDTEPVLNELPFYIAIDWQSTSQMVLTDYLYDGGHYFRFI